MPTEGEPEPAGGSNTARPPDTRPAPHPATLTRDGLPGAMAELRSERPRSTTEPADRYWLRVGLAVGVAQPERASLLLRALEPAGRGVQTTGADDGQPPRAGGDAAAADASTGGAVAESDPGAGVAGEPTDAIVAADATAADEAAGDADAAGFRKLSPESQDDPSAVPVRSMLLTRSAALPASADAETRFGWVSQLTPTEIRRLGHVVTELLANGGRRDLERGFGLAWSGGTNLPREDLRRMFGRFAELELAVSGVLGGRDLLSMPQPPESGVSAILSVFLPRTNAASSEAAAILEREGAPARRGLVAVWNAWAASRYRDRIAPELFDELAHPWVAVIGPLPGA